MDLRNKGKRTAKLKQVIRLFLLSFLLLMPVLGWAQDSSERWRRSSPGEKADIRRNYQRWQTLPPKDKEHLREEWDRWRSLPQDRRERLKRDFEELRRLRPEEQRQWRERFEEHQRFSPENRKKDPRDSFSGKKPDRRKGRERD
jgi:hypothetical protein